MAETGALPQGRAGGWGRAGDTYRWGSVLVTQQGIQHIPLYNGCTTAFNADDSGTIRIPDWNLIDIIHWSQSNQETQLAMLTSQDTQTIRDIVHSFLAEHNISYRVPPFDGELYKACIHEATCRGHPIDDDKSLNAYLRHSVKYVAATSTERAHRPAQIWLALYTTFNYFVDDVPCRFPHEIPYLYLFNDRFIKGEKQGHAILDALADLIRQAPHFFPPILSNLVITSALNFVTATLLEHETSSMQMSSAADQYPVYQRNLAGFTDAYTFMVFPRGIAFTAYIQAVPELKQFINDVNDILSFYKEELQGEKTNQISLHAARTSDVSKLDTLRRVAGSIRNRYDKIVAILGGCPEACEAFERYAVGYVEFYFAVERYRLVELDL